MWLQSNFGQILPRGTANFPAYFDIQTDDEMTNFLSHDGLVFFEMLGPLQFDNIWSTLVEIRVIMQFLQEYKTDKKSPWS